MQNYTIIPLDIEHLEEICQDIKEQYEKNIATCALFCMSLVPEGNPTIDKAAIFCEDYDKFRDRLAEMGLECGILAQSTVGHGYPLDQKFAFQNFIEAKSGNSRDSCCPYDEGFRAYIKDVMKTLAAHKPKVIMVDDDFRLMHYKGNGCVCPLHMKRLSELIGEELTREQLWEHTNKSDEKSIRITKAFIQTQGEALIGAAKAMREGIDAVDPSIPGVFCACGEPVEFAGEIAKILAGEGNPVTVRINNSNYTAAGAREQSSIAFRAAIQKFHLGKGIDCVLAETDTCPQNRYSTSAMNLHTHFTVSILEGLNGAKHWITRIASYEPNSGKAYRNVLSKYSGFYNKLAKITSELNWVGANNYLTEKISYGFGNEHIDNCFWTKCVLERLGIPLFFSPEVKGAVFLDGNCAMDFTDKECIEILSGVSVMSSRSAEIFLKRGFGEYIGVDIKEWVGPNISSERYGCNIMPRQQKIKHLIPLNKAVKADSMFYHLKDGKEKIDLFPSCTVFDNALGGRVIVFAGVPEAPFHFTTAFSFLNETRKKQLIKLLKSSGHLPVYYVGDEEVMMKAAEYNGGLFCAIFNIGFDPIEKIKLCVEKQINQAEYLNSEGVWVKCGFDCSSDILTIDLPSYTLQPVILRIN